MSEERPTFIDCANGQVAQTDCCVRVAGNLVEVLGHPLMHFTPEDAAVFGSVVLNAACRAGWIDPLEDDGK